MSPLPTTCKRGLFFSLLVLTALASAGASSPATEKSAGSGIITNDVFYKDADGNPIYSQGGGIFKFGDTYYWYGVKYNGAVTYYNDPAAGKVAGSSFNAITCYSSKDLVHWKFENNVLSAASPGMPRGWVGRMGVAYNPNTKKYVLMSQGGGGELFATCDTPTGDFTFDHVQRTIANMVTPNTGDQTVFVDTDGKAYLICCNANGRDHLYVCPLRGADFLEVEPAVLVFTCAPGKEGAREGNCMFKYDGHYYFCSSNIYGWNASPCHVIAASNILGPYSPEYVMPGTEADFCHVTQTGFFVTVQGTKATTVLFCGDRWSDFAGNGLGYNEWCPLSFDGTTPRFNSVSQFNFNATTGEWSVAQGNNYILNPGFEADRTEQSRLAGWSGSPDDARGGPNGNSKDARTGNFSMRQYLPAAYTADMTQTVTNLPSGTYTLKAWIKSSGGQTTANLYAKGFGGAEQDASVSNRMDHWTEITIPNVKVTTGQCAVGIHSDANPGDWVEADDFSLTMN